MDQQYFRSSMFQSLLSLATADGINASGKEDVYGCIFGRDSAITILKILKACSRGKVSENEKIQLYSICKNALLTLCALQGKETNIESGEEPGKFIHEYRTEKYERLLTLPKPWYVYPDGKIRNYDSLDSTPLVLIAIFRYFAQTNDTDFLLRVLPHVETALNWIITYGDRDKDFLLEYDLSSERSHGGLVVQSWTDSIESMLQVDHTFPLYPIAPVEVQGYAWLALQLWADFYSTDVLMAKTARFSKHLREVARQMKKRFNELFLIESEGLLFPVQALDGNKNQIKTVTGNPLLLLWAGYSLDGKHECILSDEVIPQVVKRAFMLDMFDESAGIRTMSKKSVTYKQGQDSYHNGSFWPKLNGMSHEGLQNFGFEDEAQLLKEATLKPMFHFGSAIELYNVSNNGEYLPFYGNGQHGCQTQAWSAAVAFDLLNTE